MSEVQFILLDTGSESNRINMSDVGKMSNGIQISKAYHHVNKIIDTLIHIHFSYTISRIVNLPGKEIWNKYCVFNDLTSDDNKEYFIVIVNMAIHELPVKYLNNLSRKPNIHLFFLLLDPFDSRSKSIQKMIRAVQFEKIFSFQESDCIKYGFEFTNQIYSKVDLNELNPCDEEKSDVYFIGLEKDRINDIYSVYRYLIEKGLKCDFTVIIKKRKLKRYKEKYPGLNFQDKRVSYIGVLKKIANTKCILELCQSGQDGLTMRFYEAVFYNKLLITNNKTAPNSQYFNSKFMQVIDKAEDIDVLILKETKNIDYKYKNDFSPELFMKNLVNIIQ